MSDMEFFINAIQERPILWDKRNKNYHNRLLSHREWENLAKIIGTTIESVKKKWKNLRDTYMKEFKKIPKPRSGTDADNEPKYTGTWPYFECMSFLTVVLKPRKTSGNIELDDDLTECDCDSIDLPNHTGAANLEDGSDMDVADNDNTQLSESILQDMHIELLFPSAPTPSPSAPTPSPSAPTPSPSAPTQSPSAPTPSPSAPRSSLSAPTPSPSAPTPSPSAPRPSPSAPTPSPSAPRPSPSAPIPSPSPTNTTKGTKRKRQDNDLQAFMEIEKEKLNLLREDQRDANDDDLLWFKSLLPYMKKLPPMNKLLFRTQMQEHLLNELSKLNSPLSVQHEHYTSL